MSDPIAVDVSNLTIEQYQNTDKRVFALKFTVRKHDGSNPNTVMHAKACDLVAYGVCRVFVHTARNIDMKTAVRLVKAKYVHSQRVFLITAPEPVAAFSLGPEPVHFPIDVDETKAHYNLEATAYTGPTIAQEKTEDTIYRATLIEPPQATDSANTIAESYTNHATDIGLRVTRIKEGYGSLGNPTGKHHVEFEVSDPVQGFPFSELRKLKSFTCFSGNNYTVQWNKDLCAKYNICKVCLKSLSTLDTIRCSCVTDTAGNWRMRKRSRGGSSSLDAAFARAADSFGN